MISQFFLSAFGFAVFFVLFRWGWLAKSARWRRIANVYGVEEQRLGDRVTQRRMQNLIVRGGGPLWESHQGITTVAVHECGVVFSLMFPFSIGAPPFLIRFEELEAIPTKWYLNAESFELRLHKIPEISLILDAEMLGWIEGQAGAKRTRGGTAPPIDGPDLGTRGSNTWS